MKLYVWPFLILFNNSLLGQPNCWAFKYFGDDLKYKACEKAEERRGHYQFSKEYQEALDEALKIDSTFAFAYRAKSTAYLKSGDFITWKYLIDKAVKFNAQENLGYRGWCRFQFFRDYQGAIDDIEQLDGLVDHEIGYSANGDYNLHIAKALCYKAINKPKIAIETIEDQLKESTYFVGIYDYLHLGVLYYEIGAYDKAEDALIRQQQENDLAENRFYLALVYKEIGDMDNYTKNLSKAKIKYGKGAKMFDPYVEQLDKIFLEDIEKEFAIAPK